MACQTALARKGSPAFILRPPFVNSLFGKRFSSEKIRGPARTLVRRKKNLKHTYIHTIFKINIFWRNEATLLSIGSDSIALAIATSMCTVDNWPAEWQLIMLDCATAVYASKAFNSCTASTCTLVHLWGQPTLDKCKDFVFFLKTEQKVCTQWHWQCASVLGKNVHILLSQSNV